MTLWETPPANYKKKIVYCLKPVDVKLEESKVGDMFDQVVVGDLNAGLLESLHGALRNVYLPIITNPKAGMLPEVIMHAFVDKYHATLASVVVAVGQTKGKTTLALPPLDVSSGGKHTAASEKAEKDRVHVLESAVVLWTNRINISLSLKPESAFDKGNHPAPEACLEFCVKHGVFPDVRVIDAAKAADALKALDKKNDAAVRYVIDCATIPAA